MISGTIDVKGIDAAIKAISDVAKRVGDHRPFFERSVVPELKRINKKCFDSAGHGQWPPLALSTIQQKVEKGYPRAPLVRTGRYRNACINLEGMRISRNKLEIRSPIRYAIYHEQGTKNIPRRQQFKLVADEMRRRIAELYQIYHNRNTR